MRFVAVLRTHHPSLDDQLRRKRIQKLSVDQYIGRHFAKNRVADADTRCPLQIKRIRKMLVNERHDPVVASDQIDVDEIAVVIPAFEFDRDSLSLPNELSDLLWSVHGVLLLQDGLRFLRFAALCQTAIVAPSNRLFSPPISTLRHYKRPVPSLTRRLTKSRSTEPQTVTSPHLPVDFPCIFA